MPYRITYGPAIVPHGHNQDKPSRLRLLTAAWLMVFSLLVRTFFPAGCAQLRTMLLPDPQNITQEALGCFMSELRNGEQFGDALYVFCKEIISHDPAVSG